MPNLILPDKLETITIKLTGKIIETKNDFHIPCRIWAIFGHRLDNTFKLRFNKSLFNSLYHELEMLEEIGDESCIVDNDMECLIGKIITIQGYSDINRLYKNKQGNMDSPKIYKVNLRYDLEEIERKGGQEFIDTQKRQYEKDKKCAYINMKVMDDELKRENERLEKRKKREKIGKEIYESTTNTSLWS